MAFHRHLLGCGCADGFGGSLQAACTVVAALLRDGGPDVNGGRNGRGGRRGRVGVLTQGPELFDGVVAGGEGGIGTRGGG